MTNLSSLRLLLVALMVSSSTTSCPTDIRAAQVLSEHSWLPTIVRNFLCSTICFLTNSDCYTIDELEFTHLIQGEEVEALKFFYTTWAEADNMDVPAGEQHQPSGQVQGGDGGPDVGADTQEG